jgi:uncharacterized protein (DUF433 family)
MASATPPEWSGRSRTNGSYNEIVEQKATKVYRNLLWQDPDRMSGAVCFYGTRIRIEDFYGWIESGGTVTDFLDSFPSITSEMLHELILMNQQDVADRLEAA